MENLTYEEFINNILESRGRFNCGDEYHERHHIVPKCIGGTNDEDNLIDLYAREHFEAHRLLAKENPDEEGLLYAWWMMSVATNEYTKERYQLTAEEYEEVRTKFASLMSDKMSGDGNRMWNRPWWDEDTPQEKIDEWKHNMVKAITKRWQDPEFKERMCRQRQGTNCGEANPMYGKPVSQETREKISQASKKCWENPEYRQKQIENSLGENNPFYGKHHSEETRKIISDKAKERYRLYGPSPNRYMKNVVQLSMDGEFIAEYSSIKEAKDATGITNISNCCRGYYQSAGGFKWKYKKDWEEMQDAVQTI
jgi:hypothetical protein